MFCIKLGLVIFGEESSLGIRAYWTLDVSRRASYEITLVRLSVCPSVCPSLSFLKIGYLVTDEARFLKKKKKNWRPEFGPNGPKSGPKLGFLPLVFLEYGYSDSRQQSLTSSRGKLLEKKLWGPNLGQRGQNLAKN